MQAYGYPVETDSTTPLSLKEATLALNYQEIQLLIDMLNDFKSRIDCNGGPIQCDGGHMHVRDYWTNWDAQKDSDVIVSLIQ